MVKHKLGSAVLVTLLTGVTIVGCASSSMSADEKEAYDTLKPRPMSDAQKEQIEKLKAKFGGPPARGTAKGKS